jgi:hypothetical protein
MSARIQETILLASQAEGELLRMAADCVISTHHVCDGRARDRLFDEATMLRWIAEFAGAIIRNMEAEAEERRRGMSELAQLQAEIAQLSSLMPVVQRLQKQLDRLLASADRALTARKALSEIMPAVQPSPSVQPVRWTDERIQMLRSLWRTHTGTEIALRLNTLEGAAMTSKDVQNRAYLLGLKKDGGFGFEPPAPIKPAAKATEQEPRSAPVFWTLERDRLLVQRAVEVPLSQIVAEINALPGEVLTVRHLERRVERFGGLGKLRASVGLPQQLPRRKPEPAPDAAPAPLPAAPEPAAEPTPPAAPAPAPPPPAALPRAIPRMAACVPAPPPKAIVADVEQIRGFLQRKGQTIDPNDIDRVNSYCLRIGAPRFILGVRASAKQAADFGAQAGLGPDAPLFAINVKRKSLGLPVFITPAAEVQP